MQGKLGMQKIFEPFMIAVIMDRVTVFDVQAEEASSAAHEMDFAWMGR